MAADHMLSVSPDSGVSWKKVRRERGRQILCNGLACDPSTREAEVESLRVETQLQSEGQRAEQRTNSSYTSLSPQDSRVTRMEPSLL